jgi:hypothetical protein
VGLILYNRDLGTLEGALASAFIAAAGPAAELIVGGSLEDFSWGETIETDESLIQSNVGLMGLACHIVVSRRFGTDDDFRERRRAIVAEHNRVWSAVCRFLADKRTLMALDEVADALTLHGSLKGAEIVHIASRHGVMDVPEIADLHRSTQGGSADAA